MLVAQEVVSRSGEWVVVPKVGSSGKSVPRTQIAGSTRSPFGLASRHPGTVPAAGPGPGPRPSQAQATPLNPAVSRQPKQRQQLAPTLPSPSARLPTTTRAAPHPPVPTRRQRCLWLLSPSLVGSVRKVLQKERVMVSHWGGQRTQDKERQDHEPKEQRAERTEPESNCE
jgi:hypothetical protein